MIDSQATNKAIIDLDSPASPAILAGILDISVGMVHQGRQDGKLPSKTTASYRECVQHYSNFYKRRISQRSTSMSEAKLAQDIRNGIAREQQQWLEIKQIKEELLDITTVKELFEPVFHIIRSSLVNLARKHPSITKEIDHMMSTLSDLGVKIAVKAGQDATYYVEEMLEKEYPLQKIDEELEEAFSLGGEDG